MKLSTVQYVVGAVDGYQAALVEEPASFVITDTDDEGGAFIVFIPAFFCDCAFVNLHRRPFEVRRAGEVGDVEPQEVGNSPALCRPGSDVRPPYFAEGVA